MNEPSLIVFRTGPRASSGDSFHVYDLAGHALVADRPLPGLEPFLRGTGLPAAARAAVRAHPWARPKIDPERPPDTRFTGWIAGAERDVRCQLHDRALSIAIDGVGTFGLDAGRTLVDAMPSTEQVDLRLLVEALLGPPLVFALAARGIWCLHASAVELPSGVVALAGSSGAGKSTLARELARIALPGLPIAHLADDILPIRFDATGAAVHALPAFPQWKLPPAAQPGRGRTRPVRLITIVQLDPRPAEAALTSKRLSGVDGSLVPVAHSTAARLFDPTLTQRHLDAAIGIAATIPILRLGYPHRPSAIAEVAQALFTSRRG